MNDAALYRKLSGILAARDRAQRIKMVGTKDDGRTITTLAQPWAVVDIATSWGRQGYTVTITPVKEAAK